MYKDLVLKYIHYLTPQHVHEFCNANNIDINNDEVLIIYKFILNNYKELLEDNNSIKKLKPLIRDNLYKQIECIYNENKTKYII